MVMPGRMFTAISIPGGSVSGQSQVNGYTLPVDLDLTSRGSADPKEYVATRMVDLDTGFESGDADDLTVYIADTAYAGTGNGDGGLARNGKYRYGFNGKEQDNETKGYADQIDYGMRIYDPRVGRFMSIDPLQKKYPWYTPYQFAGNKPIWAVDLDGLEESYYTAIWNSKTGKLEFHLDKVVEQKTFLGYKWKPTEEIIVKFHRSDGDVTTFSFTPQGHLVRNLGMGENVNKISEFESFKKSNADNIYSSEKDAILAFDGTQGAGFYSEAALTWNFVGNACRDFHDHGGAFTLNANIRTNNQATAAHGNEESVESNAATSVHGPESEVKVNTEAADANEANWNGPLDYSNLPEPRKVGPGLETTKAQRNRILNYNKKMNGGVMRSDEDGAVVDPPANVPKGGKANMNQAEVDHKEERVKGGSNSNANQRVISKKQNLDKESKRRKE